MTRQMSAAAINAVTEDELARLVLAFGFVKSRAEHLGISHADQWQLDYRENAVGPWRIVDRGAEAGESGRNIAIVFKSCTVTALRLEMETYGRAFRGLAQVNADGFSLDLMADSRRPPSPHDS